MIKSRHIWLIAGAAALITCGPVALFAKTVPWLIAIPIIAGVGLVVVLEFVQALRGTKSRVETNDETAGEPCDK
jgi:hypothetical protein